MPIGRVLCLEQLNKLNLERRAAELKIVDLILEECTRVPVTESDARWYSPPGLASRDSGHVASRLWRNFTALLSFSDTPRTMA
jgi:hypothetical protein